MSVTMAKQTCAVTLVETVWMLPDALSSATMGTMPFSQYGPSAVVQTMGDLGMQSGCGLRTSFMASPRVISRATNPDLGHTSMRDQVLLLPTLGRAHRVLDVVPKHVKMAGQAFSHDNQLAVEPAMRRHAAQGQW